MKKIVLSKILTIIIMSLMQLIITFLLFQPNIQLEISAVKAAPLLQNLNPYPDCPPNSNRIWVRLDDNNFDGKRDILEIPFSNGSIVHNGHTYVNYLLGVAIAEVGSTTDMNPVATATIQSLIAVAKTVVYENCGPISNNNTTFIGMDDNQKQVYDPTKAINFTQAELDRYQQIIDQMASVYITYNGNVFDAQYRDESNEWTNGDSAPHRSVYDLAGLHHNTLSQTGMPQINANHWATGQNHGDWLPTWDYCQILSHFYTNIEFDCLTTALPTPTEFRFVVLAIDWETDPLRDPLRWQRGTSVNFGIIIQNTGHTSITLTHPSNGSYCTGNDYENRTASLALHWYTTNNQVAEFEGHRMVLCEEIVNGQVRTHIAPGEVYPHQSGNSPTYYEVEVWVPETLSVGLYTIKFDMELRDPHPVKWISLLHPTTNPTSTHWPLQSFPVQINAAPFNIPQEPDIVSLSHSTGTWSNNAMVSIEWQSNEPDIAYFNYAWENNGLISNWQTTTANTINLTRPDGKNNFYLQSVNTNGQASDVRKIESILIDTQPPTATINPLPTVISNPTLSTITFAWQGEDKGGSGFHFELAYAVQSPTGEPPPDPLKRQPIITTNNTLTLAQLGIPLQANYTYHFWLRGRDKANNISSWQKVQTHYQPVPMFGVMPPQIVHYQLYTNTTPITNTITITNLGAGILNWVSSSKSNYTYLNYTQGIAPSKLIITITNPLTIGQYNYPITFTGPISTYNNPTVLPIKVYIVSNINKNYLPFISKTN